MDNNSIENNITVEVFLKEIRKLKLTGREFLAIIGNSKISNDAYKEIKENPQLTYRRLVEILSASPLTSYDYARLLRASMQRKKSTESDKRTQSEKKLTEAVKAASVRIETSRESITVNAHQQEPSNDVRTRGDYSLAYKPEFNDFYEENEIDDDENPSFIRKQPEKIHYDKMSEPVLFSINSKRTEKVSEQKTAVNEKKEQLNTIDRKEYINEKYNDIYSNYENDEDDENYEENNEYSGIEKHTNRYTRAAGDESENNRGKIVFGLIFGVLLVVLSFALRYWQTGSFSLSENLSAEIKKPADYTELAKLLYRLDNTPAEADTENETDGMTERYYIDLSADFFRKKKICFNERYIFTVTDNMLFCVEPGTSNGNIRQSGCIKPDGETIIEIFLYEHKLYMICEGEYESEYYSENPLTSEETTSYSSNGEFIPPEPVKGNFTQPYTAVYIYNADKFDANPLSEINFDGKYDCYSIFNKSVFIYTDYNVENANAQDDLRAFIPSYSVNGKNNFLSFDNIYLPLNEFGYSNMKTFCSIDKNNEVTANAVMGGQKIDVYTGSESLFFICSDKDKTNIVKYNSNEALYASVDGISSAEAIDERGGIIRVCAELNGYTRIYIFNNLFEPLSVINSVAKGEALKSVLFDDRFVYVITDLLYVFDTSMPDDPIIVNDSAVSIYRDNYYRWSEKERFSVLYETDAAGKTTGIRLRMFRIEKGEYIEKGNILINAGTFGAGLWNEHVKSPAVHDINSMYYDSNSGMILIPVVYFDGISEIERYIAVSYNETEGFAITGGLVYYDWNKKNHKAVCIKGYVYTFWDKTVISAKVPSMTDVKSMELTVY